MKNLQDRQEDRRKVHPTAEMPKNIRSNQNLI
jgi:hypothetical protein